MLKIKKSLKTAQREHLKAANSVVMGSWRGHFCCMNQIEGKWGRLLLKWW